MTSQVNSAFHPSIYIDLNEKYTSYGFKQIIQRHCEYARERPYGVLNGRALPMTLIAVGGIVGLAVGTKIAEKLEIEKNGKRALQGSAAVVRGIAGASIYCSITEADLFFKTWKLLKITQPTLQFVFKNHEKDEFLNQFVDCIHYTPIVVPVRLSSGYLMDLDTLKNIKPDKNGDILCPHTNKLLHLKNPKIDLELYTLILKRFQHLLQHDLIRLSANSEEYKASKMQLDVIEKILCSTYEKHLKGIDGLHQDGKITNLESNRLKSQFYNYFGIDPIGKADLENGIESHQMNFGLDWKKIIIDHSKVIFKGTPPTQFLEGV